jgi:hypothetical protein
MSGCAENSGPPDTLQKPFKMADLWSKVSDALNGALAVTPTCQTRNMKPQA